MNNGLELRDDIIANNYNNIIPKDDEITLDMIPDVRKMPNIFDNVDIIIDPDLEDESTVDIKDYMNKYILQCRICGNMFPSEELLDDDSTCPICDCSSPDGFIFKGKLKQKPGTNENVDEMSKDEKEAIDDLMSEDTHEDEDSDKEDNYKDYNLESSRSENNESENGTEQTEINLDTILNKK